MLLWLRQTFSEGYQSRVNEILGTFKKDFEMREERIVGRAQQIFVQYHARCFWHLQKDLKITGKHIPLIQEGLRKYGGREGFWLADELRVKKE